MKKIVKFETVTLTDYDGAEKTYTCYLNLNPSTVKVDGNGGIVRDDKGYPLYDETVANDGLTKYLAYNEEITNEAGETKKNLTSKNMCVGFLTMDTLEKKYRTEEGFECEALIFVNTLIRAAHGFEK